MKKITSIKYKRKLDLIQTQKAIVLIKNKFQNCLEKKLCLQRVSAPMFVQKDTGLNDDLNGTERPVSFNALSINGEIQIVHSLAKWKRMALKKYNILDHCGIYTDMNAIRRDENIDFYHSIYVDQWDWEVRINKEDRNLQFLKLYVKKIYSCIYKINQLVEKIYPMIKHNLVKNIYFISSSKLEALYPNLTRKEREDQICRQHKAVFIYQIGWNLKDNFPHDGRAADYDDWNLNGDILVYNELYDMAFELSSMGIRVDKDSLKKQLQEKNELYKLDNQYCRSILNDELPLSIGGGIGQSRLCMFLLDKAHIGEVQVSLWSESELKVLKSLNIDIL